MAILAVCSVLSTDYPSIQAAIDDVASRSGGRVVVPAGIHRCRGAVHLRSNCELHLRRDAVVVFSDRIEDYLPAVRSSWGGIECMNFSPLVYAFDCTNVAITGVGELRAFEGEYKDTHWHAMHYDRTRMQAIRRTLYEWGETDCPVEKRDIWNRPGACTRPQFIQFNRCRDVRLDGFSVRQSPCWTIHLLLCDGVIVRNLDVVGRAWSNDGLDIEMSRNVLVERCRFDQGDDSIVLKAGRNRDGWRIGVPTENVEIRDCHFERSREFVSFGSEVSAGIRNVFVHDCSIGRCGRVCYIKTNRRRGGFVKNVRFENVFARQAESILAVDADIRYSGWADCPDGELRTTRVEGVSLRNVFANEVAARVNVQGDATDPVRGVRLENVTVGHARASDRFVNVTDVTDDGLSVMTAREYPITDFGARPEDATSAIRQAVKAASRAGCGRVSVPPGEWTCGPIDLMDGVELYLHPSAKLLFSDDPALYRTSDGAYRPLVRLHRVRDCRISSGCYGVLEAQEKGWAGIEASLRPSLVGISCSTNVAVDRVALHNAPAAVVAIDGSGDVSVLDVEFIAQVKPDGFVRRQASENVFVSGSFRMGDGRLPLDDPRLRVVSPTVDKP